jgi:hypothetical protein
MAMIGAYQTDKIDFKHDTVDKWGHVLSTTTLNLRCRVVRKRRKIVDFKGEEVLSELSILIKRLDYPGGTLDFTWRATVLGQEWPIRAIRQPKDFSWGIFEVFL